MRDIQTFFAFILKMAMPNITKTLPSFSFGDNAEDSRTVALKSWMIAWFQISEPVMPLYKLGQESSLNQFH